LCKKPDVVEGQDLPHCLKLVTPDHTVEAVMQYYTDGVLPPIGEPSRIYSLPVVEAPPLPPPPLAALPTPYPLNEPEAFRVLDHPIIGGRVTFFVLGYGKHTQLVTRCIDSILATCAPQRFDLRVALNQPCGEMLGYVQALAGRGIVSKIYTDHGERRKYPAMRTMFWDESHPITSNYLCWFDDDSWCKSPVWLPELAKVIVANHPRQARLFGPRYIHDLAPARKNGLKPEHWFQAAAWWRKRDLFTANGTRTSPNGTQIVFASGGFWALGTAAMREADIPDARLNHNGGDIVASGCQVTQAGYKVVDFSHRKDLVCWSDCGRRGFHEPFPWMLQPAVV
jgi:hypothetical protein